jgi:hypothetical protein
MQEVIAAFIIALALCVSLGGSMALASRGILTQGPLWRSFALWALLALQALVFLPVSGFVLHRFADWSLFYLIDTARLGEPAVLSAAFPVIAMVSFIVVRRLLIANKVPPALGITVGALLVAAACGWLARGPLLVVGTFDNYRHATNLRPLAQTSLAYLLAGGGLLVLISWITTLWRLAIVGLAAKRALGQTPKATTRRSSHADNTQPPSPRRK